MLYFDNAATSWPKPVSVKKAVCDALQYYGANPGRSGHEMAMETAGKIYSCRNKAAELFGISAQENIVFTKNCTEAINIVLMSMEKNGGHIIISDLEHNSVLRPLYELKKRGNIDFSVAEVFENEPEKTLESYRKLIRGDTKMLVATGESNVFGIKLPVDSIARLANEHGILFMLDAAQVAGSEKINMEESSIDFLCAPGHKGLLGPMGTGILATRKPDILEPLLFGGTGNYSLYPSQPKGLPEMLESGTLNVPGICGLFAGLDKIAKEGEESIGKREVELAAALYKELSAMKNIKLFTAPPKYCTHGGVLSFVLGDLTGEGTAELLSQNGIAARGGFHCAALAHEKMGTEKRGTCRLSIGAMTSEEELRKLIKIMHGISKNI